MEFCPRWSKVGSFRFQSCFDGAVLQADGVVEGRWSFVPGGVKLIHFVSALLGWKCPTGFENSCEVRRTGKHILSPPGKSLRRVLTKSYAKGSVRSYNSLSC